MKRKICVVTGSRAEYGLLSPLIKELSAGSDFLPEVVVTGAHLEVSSGYTYRIIQKDGFKIAHKIKTMLPNDSKESIASAIGVGVTRFARLFSRYKPELLVILGDRFEIFAVAIAAYISRIPMAHLYGGELTEGALDDGFRHSITKMSLLHFVSTDQYKKRVIQLGEDPSRVFKVGALGIDNIKNMRLLSKRELEQELDFKFARRNFLVTFHPATLEEHTETAQCKQLLSALDHFKDAKLIFTYPNADIGSRAIIKLVKQYAGRNPSRCKIFISLGQERYLSTIKYIDLVAGNSSSGLIEVPSFGKPTVNIGDRQLGRERPASVIDCKPEKEDIIKALRKASSSSFKESSMKVKNPYGDGQAAVNIVKILRKQIPCIVDTKKRFYDVKYSY